MEDDNLDNNNWEAYTNDSGPIERSIYTYDHNSDYLYRADSNSRVRPLPNVGASSSSEGASASGEGQSTYPRYFKTKSFPQHRPPPYYRPYPHSRNAHISVYEKVLPGSQKNIDKILNDLTMELSPRIVRIDSLISAVRAQEGVVGDLVFFTSEGDNPTVILQNAVQGLKNGVLTVKQREGSQIFELLINGEKMAEGTYQNKQLAKNALCETALSELRLKCFNIFKKKNYEEISTDDINNAKKEAPSSSSKVDDQNKGFKMMVKMGWKGKGLGYNEQGRAETVAELMTQNVTKAGLGGKNPMNEIQTILEDFAKSTKVNVLAFDSGFTKEERAHIHKMAGKFNLKSKSEGKDGNRRVTIGKKIGKWELVRELLLLCGDNDSYSLVVPPHFRHIWNV